MMDYPISITFYATKTINGFTEGEHITAHYYTGGLYRFVLNNGNEKYISYFLDKTGNHPHLWDGVDWDDAGEFIKVSELSHNNINVVHYP